ncbi:MAG TPA: sodium:solute symporter family protein [Flavisolibacter sp.]|jgi:SSS family solute:Na+ symporter
MKVELHLIDYIIMVIYFVFVLGIGWFLRKYMKDAKQFLEAGRSLPAWVTGLAFISTNLGALEVMGMTGSGAKYGMLTTHFYWVGAIPAMVFLAVFMMRFYYGSKARSVPEYLKLRFDEKTRALNAILFAVMTILASGISMYALALLMEQVLGWNFNLSLWLSAAVVLAYTYLGGLSSAIYNEVLQFFIILIGLLPIVILTMLEMGGWGGLKEHLAPIVSSIPGKSYAADTFTTTWKYTGSANANPLGVEWYGIFAGLGFVLSFGYWCTNFLIVQRAMAAESTTAARKTPLIGALPKMFIPFLIIVPGIAALVLMHNGAIDITGADGEPNYNLTIIMLLKHYLPAGVLGVGITALLASFMSGMAGNVSAFNTVWTYDIYQSYIRPATSDQAADAKHYLFVGRMATIFGVLVSIAAAYLAGMFGNIMDFLQTIFSMINAPLFAVIFLGMFWKRSTGHGAFLGLLLGFLVALAHHGLTAPEHANSLVKGGWLGTVVHTYPVEMAQNFWTAIFACATATVVTVTVSLATKREKTDQELQGLVYAFTPKISEANVPWIKRTNTLALLVLVIFVILSILFW